jgi:uncharacterized protein with GYD domain
LGINFSQFLITLGRVETCLNNICNLKDIQFFYIEKGVIMRKYLFHGKYTPEGYRGLLQEGGTVRIDVSKLALGSVGGSLEAFFYSCNEEDFYIIVNLPDYVSAMAVTLAGNSSGTFSIRATELLTPEEVDAAVKKRVDFRPPGH